MRIYAGMLAMALPFAAFAAPHVIAVNVDGVIHPITVEIINRAIDQARRENANALLIRLNTPGGLLDATRHLDQALLKSAVPVITYVTPSGGRAASAGFFILEAGDVAAMAPGTNTGAASPVLLNQEMDKVMRAKVENDSAAMLRTMMANRGRNVPMAESTVREAKSFTEREALDNHLIDFVSPDEQSLFNTLNGREISRFDGQKVKLQLAGAQVTEYEETFRERVISSIADPNLAFILLIAGALGLYAEFSSPGLILPGVAGAISLLLGLSGLSVLPINWVGVALLILSIAFFIAEAKFASHGVLGAGGTVAMIFGAVLLIDAPPDLRIHYSTAIAVTIPFALITMFLVTLVLKARQNKVITGEPGMLEEIGEARTPLAPRGTVFVHGEYWNAESSVPVDAGTRVRVVRVDGLLLKVEPDTK